MQDGILPELAVSGADGRKRYMEDRIQVVMGGFSELLGRWSSI